MNYKSLRLLAALVVALFTESARADISLPPVVITSAKANNGQLTLSWTGGRATYQLQARSNPSALWTNIGVPTSNNIAVVSLNTDQSYFRVVSDYTAHYQVVFNATWSQQTVPTNWPSGAHFSGLVGGTHNANVHFWRDGETASVGIRLMAEQGQKPVLLNEVALAGTNAQIQLTGSGISPSPGSVTMVFAELMKRDYPLVTLVSMIAPSPDWFVGVDSLSLIEDGQWTANKVVTLYGKDAGTDSGITYTSPDQVTSPHSGVTQFSGFPALQNGVVVPFGTFTFMRLD
jgi:hypothetical protein